ncbi:hypothetical protein Tco_1244980 [Tanacetum coccineum]
MENYKNVLQDIRDQLNAEAEAVQIILTGIDNDIYFIVDACPNACKMCEKQLTRLKQGESLNVLDLFETIYIRNFGKFTSRDGESLESYYSRFYKMMNELVRNQCHVTNHQVIVSFLLQSTRMARSQQSTRNRGKSIVNSSAPIYDQEPATVTEDDEMLRNKVFDKLHGLNSLSVQLNAEQADWKDDIDDESEDQGIEGNIICYMQTSEVLQIKLGQFWPTLMMSQYISNDIYMAEQSDTNITIDSLDICYDRVQDDQDDTANLDQERDFACLFNFRN